MTDSSSAPSMCGTLTSDVAVRQCRDELAQLAETADAASSIVQHPDWLLFELESRGQAASPHVVVERDHDGRVIGYLPLLCEVRRAQIKLGKRGITLYRGRMLRMLGSGVVAAPDRRHAVEKAIAAELRRNPAARVIQIQETGLPNTLAALLSCGPHRFTILRWNLLDQLNWVIQPQESLATYLTGLGSRRKKLAYAVRNVYKKLGAEAHFRIFDSPDHIDDYCRLMNQLYARSWHARAKNIDWELPARRTLFAQLARKQQAIGHMLMLGERPVALVHGYRLGGRYELEETFYDQEFASLGVGSALVFQTVQDLLERYPGELIDFGYGDNVYKRVLGTRNVPCGALYAVRGAGPFVCFWMIVPLRWLYQGLRWFRRKLRGADAAI